MGWRGRGRKQENLNVLCVPLRALRGETVPRHGWPAHTHSSSPFLVAEPSYESPAMGRIRNHLPLAPPSSQEDAYVRKSIGWVGEQDNGNPVIVRTVLVDGGAVGHQGC